MSSKYYTIDGFTGTVAQIAHEYQMNPGTLLGRLNSGMSIEEAVTTPVKKHPTKKARTYEIVVNSEKIVATAHEIGDKFNINYRTFQNYILDGATPQEAIDKILKSGRSTPLGTKGLNKDLTESSTKEKSKKQKSSTKKKSKKGSSRKSYEINGHEGTLADIARIFEIPYKLLWSRLKSGMALEDAVTLPIPTKKTTAVNTEEKTFSEEVKGETVHSEDNKEDTADATSEVEDFVKNTEESKEEDKSTEEIDSTSVYPFRGKRCTERYLELQKEEEKKKQGRPYRIYTVNGHSGTVKELAEIFKINPGTVNSRINNGWSIEQAFLTPVYVHNEKFAKKYNVGKYKGTLHDIADRFGMNYFTILSKCSENKDDLESVIEEPTKIRFFNVYGFRGTLAAISEEFKVPISYLEDGLVNRKNIESLVDSYVGKTV